MKRGGAQRSPTALEQRPEIHSASRICRLGSVDNQVQADAPGGALAPLDTLAG